MNLFSVNTFAPKASQFRSDEDNDNNDLKTS